MILRCTFLCMAMAIFAVAPSRGQAQPYGPPQAAYGPYQPGFTVPTAPGWTHQYPAMPYNGAVAYPQFASYEMADEAAEQPGDANGNGPSENRYVLSDYPDTDCYNCGGCCSQCRVWADFEVLWWWRQSRYLPELVTTSVTPPIPPPNQAGVIGFPPTRVLFGGDRITESPHFGARCQVGIWLNDSATLGVAATGFAAGEESQRFFAQSTGDPILARPFFNTTTLTNAAFLVAYPQTGGGNPGAVDGSIEIFADNEIVGGELYFRKKLNHYFLGECAGFLMQGPTWLGSIFNPFGRGAYGSMGYNIRQGLYGNTCVSRIDLIAGYQYTRISDSLFITTNQVNQDGTILTPVGTMIEAADLFAATNEFHGGTFGLLAEVQRGRVKLEAIGKLGIGSTHQEVLIAGRHQFTTPAGVVGPLLPGALLAQPSNMGTYDRDRFTLVPEARLKLKYQVNCNLDITLGYSLIYWTQGVALAGQQVDTNLGGPCCSPQLGPGPDFVFQDSSFWAQGIDCGVRVCF